MSTAHLCRSAFKILILQSREFSPQMLKFKGVCRSPKNFAALQPCAWYRGAARQIFRFGRKALKRRHEEFYWQILEATGNLHIAAGNGSRGRLVGRSSDGFSISCKFWRLGTKGAGTKIATAS